MDLVRPTIERRMRLLQTIHRDIAAVEPVSPWLRGEHDHISDFLGGAEPAHRKTMAHVIVEILRVGEPIAVPAVTLDEYRARGDGVDANTVRYELQRPTLGVENQRRFSRTVLPGHCELWRPAGDRC